MPESSEQFVLAAKYVREVWVEVFYLLPQTGSGYEVKIPAVDMTFYGVTPEEVMEKAADFTREKLLEVSNIIKAMSEVECLSTGPLTQETYTWLNGKLAKLLEEEQRGMIIQGVITQI